MQKKVKPKKQLGQHFLTDDYIAGKIAESIGDYPIDRIIEVGAGMGILTKPLLSKYGSKLACVEIDRESVDWLKKQDWTSGLQILEGDFLKP